MRISDRYGELRDTNLAGNENICLMKITTDIHNARNAECNYRLSNRTLFKFSIYRPFSPEFAFAGEITTRKNNGSISTHVLPGKGMCNLKTMLFNCLKALGGGGPIDTPSCFVNVNNGIDQSESGELYSILDRFLVCDSSTSKSNEP